jgi:hypothetical protein
VCEQNEFSATIDSNLPMGGKIVAAGSTMAKTLEHLAMQAADPRHSFIAGSSGMPPSWQHSWADATRTSEVANSSWTAKACATGSMASPSATKKANVVRPTRMQVLDATGMSVVALGWSSDDFASSDQPA